MGKSTRMGKSSVAQSSCGRSAERSHFLDTFGLRRHKHPPQVGSRRLAFLLGGHRQEFTLLRVTEILTDGAKPSQTARPKREPKKPAATAPAEAGEPDEAKRPKAKAGPKTRGRAAGAKKPAKSPAKKPQKPKSGGKD